MTAVGLIRRFRQIATSPRREDKAQVYMIPPGALPEREGYDPFEYDVWEDIIAELELNILWYCRYKGPPIRRGDIIMIEARLNQEGAQGGQDVGKLAFDGQHVIRWESMGDDMRFLPETFQVIGEFPLQYWSDVFDDSDEMYVPFDFEERLPNIPLTNIVTLQTKRGPMRVLPIHDQRGHSYYIIWHHPGTFGDVEELFNQLRYFGTLDATFSHSGYHGLNQVIQGLTLENTLVVPNIIIPIGDIIYDR
jgi:hypothetical protein